MRRNHCRVCKNRGCSLCCPKPNNCPQVCPTGPAGAPGPQGERGDTGPCCTGPTGPGAAGTGTLWSDSLTANRSTTSPTFVDLLTLPIDNTLSCVEILATFSANVTANAGAGSGFFQLAVDGVAVPNTIAVTEEVNAAGTTFTREIGAIQRAVMLTPGPHTISLQWRADASSPGGVTVSVPAADDFGHASLRALEVPSCTIITEP